MTPLERAVLRWTRARLVADEASLSDRSLEHADRIALHNATGELLRRGMKLLRQSRRKGRAQ
jgi:hypothetical protein